MAKCVHRSLVNALGLLLRRGYANAAPTLSTRNARGAATTSRLPRHAFRTVLRLAEALPPVKQRMFPVRAA